MEEVFPKPPIVGYKRQKNIKDYLIRSKVPPIQSNKPNRQSGGMKKCGKPCPTCPLECFTKPTFQENKGNQAHCSLTHKEPFYTKK